MNKAGGTQGTSYIGNVEALSAWPLALGLCVLGFEILVAIATAIFKGLVGPLPGAPGSPVAAA